MVPGRIDLFTPSLPGRDPTIRIDKHTHRVEATGISEWPNNRDRGRLSAAREPDCTVAPRL